MGKHNKFLNQSNVTAGIILLITFSQLYLPYYCISVSVLPETQLSPRLVTVFSIIRLSSAFFFFFAK